MRQRNGKEAVTDEGERKRVGEGSGRRGRKREREKVVMEKERAGLPRSLSQTDARLGSRKRRRVMAESARERVCVERRDSSIVA